MNSVLAEAGETDGAIEIALMRAGEFEETSASSSTAAWVLELGRLGTQVQRLEDRVDDFDGTSPFEWMAELQPGIERTIEDAREVLSRICDNQDAREGDQSRIGDLAFCALVDLRVRHERFSRSVASLSGPALAAEAGGLLHNLMRALTAVQEALCEEANLRPTLSLSREVGLALEVRSVYAKFRRDIEAIAAEYRPEVGDAETALCSAATCIAKLIGRDVFSRLRLQDRLQLHTLQERILAWRVEAAPEPGLARRLWQDLYSCTQLLQQVNRRQELVEHDRRVLEEIEEMVALAPSAEVVRSRVLVTASRLEGRDLALDALLRQSPSMAELLAVLRALPIAAPQATAVEDEH